MTSTALAGRPSPVGEAGGPKASLSMPTGGDMAQCPPSPAWLVTVQRIGLVRPRPEPALVPNRGGAYLAHVPPYRHRV